MQITIIGHKVWTDLVNNLDIEEFIGDDIGVLFCLLSEWQNRANMAQYNTPGPYISSYEQQLYLQHIPLIIQPISAAIIDLQFEPCFEVNGMGIKQWIQSQKHSGLVFLCFSFFAF